MTFRDIVRSLRDGEVTFRLHAAFYRVDSGALAALQESMRRGCPVEVEVEGLTIVTATLTD